jgi:hypothetical protein
LEKNDKEYSNYHCTQEWHLTRLRDAEGHKAPFAAILYPFAFRISKKSGRFHCSAVKIAEHFAVSEWTVLRAMRALMTAGFFDLINKEVFQSSVYRVVSHVEWAKAHPGGCAIRSTFPLSSERGDELGVRLFNASGGRLKYQPYKLAALRATGLSDDEIVKRFEDFVAHETARREAGGWHGPWKAVGYRFLQHLKGDHPQEELIRLRFKANECEAKGRQDDLPLTEMQGAIRQATGEEVSFPPQYHDQLRQLRDKYSAEELIWAAGRNCRLYPEERFDGPGYVLWFMETLDQSLMAHRRYPSYRPPWELSTSDHPSVSTGASPSISTGARHRLAQVPDK